MWIFTFIIIFFALFINSNVHVFLADLIFGAHTFCIQLSPKNSDFSSLYGAIVCGSTPEPSQFINNLKTVGLIHLLVVSGSHFIFLEMFLNILLQRIGRLGQVSVFIFLSLFAMACQLSPPVTRAWMSFMLRKCSEENKLFWRGHHTAIASGLFCLCIYPEWILSLSFQLSWAASLFSSLPTQTQWKKHTLIYLGLMPVVAGLQPQHPITILCNWLLAPAFGLLLLPASALAMVFSPFTKISDFTWSCFTVLAQKISVLIPLTYTSSTYQTGLIWIYLAGAHIVIYFLLRHSAREKL